MSDNQTGSCCANISEAQQLRNEAMIVVRRANVFIEAGDPDSAEPLVAAGATLVAKSGGTNACEEAVWVWTAMSCIAQKRGWTAEAVSCSERARVVALAVHGLDHPCTALTIGNLGETLLDDRRTAQARECLQEAIKLLELSAPVGHYTREYMDGVLATLRPMLERATAIIEQEPKTDPAGGDFVFLTEPHSFGPLSSESPIARLQAWSDFRQSRGK